MHNHKKIKMIILILSILSILNQIETSNLHHVQRRQTQQANVCNANECIFGTCEILSSNSYICHCNQGIGGKSCNQRLPVNSSPCLTNPVCF